MKRRTRLRAPASQPVLQTTLSGQDTLVCPYCWTELKSPPGVTTVGRRLRRKKLMTNKQRQAQLERLRLLEFGDGNGGENG